MPQVTLDLTRAEDGPELIAAHRESRTFHAPWVAPFTEAEGFTAWLAEIATGTRAGLVAREVATGRIAGVTSLSQIFRKGFQNAYLSYWGMAGFAGRGLMTEAVWLTLDHAFGPLGLHRLEVNIQPGNTRSIALVRRLGFRKEGFSPRFLKVDGAWRDHERWAILADEHPAPGA
jgi:[ribosomal protein S5]-alanine N-acetyltransferase